MGAISAGELDRRVIIQTPTITRSTAGEAQISAWTTFATVWAKVTPIYGSERFTASETHSFKAAKFLIRYLSGVTESMRISHDGDYYGITGIAEVGFREGLQLTAEAVE